MNLLPTRGRPLIVVALGIWSSGCGLILGIGDFVDAPADAGTGGGGGLGTGGSGGAGSAGGNTGTTGTGGEAGGMACSPGAVEACYSGPAGTEGKGLCKAGSRMCEDDGSAWGACVGEQGPAAETCAASDDEDCDGYDCALWAGLYGDSNLQQARGVAVDPAGNAYVAGRFAGTIAFGGTTLISVGQEDIFLAKLDAKGGAVWARRYGDAGSEDVEGIALDPSGNIALVGSTSGTFAFDGLAGISPGIFVAKLDGVGNPIWSKGVGGALPSLLFEIRRRANVAMDAQGNVVVAGSYQGSVDFGGGALPSAGGADVFVARLRGSDGSATAQGFWAKRFGDTAEQLARDVAVDASGAVLVTGTFGVKPGNTTVALCGAPLTNAGGLDVFVSKLTPAGNCAWSTSFGGADDQFASSIAVDAAGGVVIVGGFKGEIDASQDHLASAGQDDAFVVKLDSTGNAQWGRQFGDASDQHALVVGVDAAGGFRVGGVFSGTIDAGGVLLTAPDQEAHAFVVKLDSQGEAVWGRAHGTSGAPPIPNGLVVTQQGETLIAGWTFGLDAGIALDLGAGTFVTSGSSDAFLLELAP